MRSSSWVLVRTAQRRTTYRASTSAPPMSALLLAAALATAVPAHTAASAHLDAEVDRLDQHISDLDRMSPHPRPISAPSL